MRKLARSELLSLVSHDLRAPLGVILGATGEMLNGRMGALDDEQRGQLALVRRSAEKIARVAADVALAHEIDAGTLVLERRRMDVRELVERAIERVDREGELARVEVTRDFAASEVLADVDEARALHALVNLVAGAAKSARARLRVAVSSRDGRARVEIERDGASITPEVAQFFERAVSPESEDVMADPPFSRAMGLGLWAAETIARAHGRGLALEARDGATAIVWTI